MLPVIFWREAIHILRADNKAYNNKLNWFAINQIPIYAYDYRIFTKQKIQKITLGTFIGYESQIVKVLTFNNPAIDIELKK